MRFQLSIEATPEEWVPTLAMLRASLDTLAGAAMTSPAAVGAADAPPPLKFAPVDPKRLREGCAAFGGLVATWTEGFGEVGAAQPDRVGALRDAMGEHGRDILLFLQEAGGLTSAVEAVLMRPDGTAGPVDDPRYARKIAENMAQVGSLICPPIAEALYHPQIRATVSAGE